ncbi:MAG: chromosomal replication initiator protein DnaA [Flavobacteriales bacterium]|jgi:chromosomal replication initiator protein|nr:chromosomal replication initiator protein DnaA [Flavobacteriales bacterium]
MSKIHEEAWESCLKVIKDNISLQAFKTWFMPIVPIKLENSILTIQVPSHFFYEWLEEHYITLLRKVVKKEIGPEGSLEYSIVMENNSKSSNPYTVKIPTNNTNSLKNAPVNVPIDMNEKQIRNPFIIPGLKKVNIESNLQSKNTFENFIEGECNRLARASGFAVSNKPGGTAFNPLLLYGGVGLGKTHLAQAIGISIKDIHPNKIVLYVQSETFTHQFIDALKNNRTNDFVHFYQMVDVLIIDDVQFFAGKEKTQDVFFSIFNHLHQNGKQIVLTSDKPPIEMQGMEQRLLSRFKWGLSADLGVPDLETRIAILEKKMYGSGIELPKEVVEYLAYSINTNVREIEGALNTLLAQASLNKKAITLELAKQMVDKFVKSTAREVSIEYIQKIVCDYFDLPIEMLKSKTRKREVVQARQISMFFSKKMTKSSLANIGAHCGGKDHATVLHACRTVVNLSETDKQFRHYLEELEKKLTIQ